ncbi:hypothetical protein O71_18975 [Pontibacter sp. BAB1700]|nr:hypothetical protein O71_18975 [Pontibacter sp. BAB1700]
MLLPFLSYAQQQVNGQVLHAKTRQALEGVTVTVNTGEQALTNNSGRFDLSVADQATFLLISHIGIRPILFSYSASSQVRLFGCTYSL